MTIWKLKNLSSTVLPEVLSSGRVLSRLLSIISSAAPDRMGEMSGLYEVLWNVYATPGETSYRYR